MDNSLWVFTEFDILTRISVDEEFVKTRKSKQWNKYYPSDSNIDEPELTIGIRTDVMNAAIDMIKVKTWKEFKP